MVRRLVRGGGGVARSLGSLKAGTHRGLVMDHPQQPGEAGQQQQRPPRVDAAQTARHLSSTAS